MSLYERLNLHPSARPAEIKEAYNRERARLLSEEGEDDVSQELTALEEAYAILIDPGQRAAYDRSLKSESLSGAIVRAEQPAPIVQPAVPSTTVQRPCFYCQEPNPIQASTCLSCGRQISRPCPNCGQSVQIEQTICARCGIMIDEYSKARLAEATAVEADVERERRESKARVSALEAVHKINARRGALFWLIVIFVCIGLTVLAVILYNYFSQAYQL